MTTHTALVPGVGTALIGASSFALLASAPRSLVARLWPVVEAGGDIDALLDAASAEGLRTLGAFALAQLEPNGVRLLVRGDAAAVITTTTDRLTFDARAVRTWAEHFVEGVDSFELRIGSDGTTADQYHIGTGVVPATAIIWPHDPSSANQSPSDHDPAVPIADLLDDDRESSAGAGAEDELPIPAAPEGDALGVMQPSGIAEPTVHISRFDEADFDADGRAPSHDHDHDGHTRPNHEHDHEHETDEGVGTPDHGRDLAQPLDDVADDPDVGGADYDALYGRTIHRSVQQAAVEPDADPADGASTDEPAGGPTDSPVTAGPTRPPSPMPPTGPPSGVISGVPSAAVPPPEPPKPLEGDHDGHTISAAQLRAMRAAAAGTPGPSPTAALGGATVQAVVCTAGHANPPHLATCRTCSAPLDGPPQVTARPSLGRITLSTGDVIELTRPAVIGRNPKVEGRLPSEVPQTIRLDVGQALSRSHAMIRLEGWQVLVEDLGSANGTLVTLPGRIPQRLHAGEPILLEPGSEIDLGGEITGTYRLESSP